MLDHQIVAKKKTKMSRREAEPRFEQTLIFDRTATASNSIQASRIVGDQSMFKRWRFSCSMSSLPTPCAAVCLGSIVCLYGKV